jgi:uncharacterized protein (UPF0261 family)
MNQLIYDKKIAVALIGTLDTKLPEYLFVQELLTLAGAQVRMVDVSLRGDGFAKADVLPAEIATQAGKDLATVHGLTRGDASQVMIDGATRIIGEWVEKNEVQGVLALGGANGTTIACGVMRTLPIGFPKVMVSTMASGQVRHYVEASDIVMIPSIGDLSLNRISRKILSGAVGAVLGMASLPFSEDSETLPLLAMTSFGVTQACVDRAKHELEAKGFEVVLFHASGSGGRALEELAVQGIFDGVVDLTTSELTDALVGGSFSAGPGRLESAGRHGLPQVIVPGAIDLINFWVQEFPQEKFSGRLLHRYNPDIILMRANEQESRELGRIMAQKLNGAQGPVLVLIPLQGFSLLDDKDGPPVLPYEGSPPGSWYDAAANRAFVDALKKNRRDFEIYEVDFHINDPGFADIVVEKTCGLFDRLNFPKNSS